MEAVVFLFSLLDCCALIFLSVYFPWNGCTEYISRFYDELTVCLNRKKQTLEL